VLSCQTDKSEVVSLALCPYVSVLVPEGDRVRITQPNTCYDELVHIIHPEIGVT
jgi:hypothetical protein